MFKIFIHSGGQGVKYYCGKKAIKPASEVHVCDALVYTNKIQLNLHKATTLYLVASFQIPKIRQCRKGLGLNRYYESGCCHLLGIPRRVFPFFSPLLSDYQLLDTLISS